MPTSEVPSLPPEGRVRLILASAVRVVFGLAAIFLALALVPERPDGRVVFPIGIVLAGVGLYAWFFSRQIHRIRASRYPYIQAGEATILVAAMFLAVFAAFYVVISTADPAAFTEPLDHFTAYYFALTVLATVGFGDITPVTTLARATAMVQMAIDIALVAVIVRIVFTTAKQSVERKSGSTGSGS